MFSFSYSRFCKRIWNHLVWQICKNRGLFHSTILCVCILLACNCMQHVMYLTKKKMVNYIVCPLAFCCLTFWVVTLRPLCFLTALSIHLRPVALRPLCLCASQCLWLMWIPGLPRSLTLQTHTHTLKLLQAPSQIDLSGPMLARFWCKQSDKGSCSGLDWIRLDQ